MNIIDFINLFIFYYPFTCNILFLNEILISFYHKYRKNNLFASVLPSSLLYNLEHKIWYLVFSQDNRKMKYSFIQLLFIIGIKYYIWS